MDERAFFDVSFAALTGNAPLGWQRRLFLEHFLRGDIAPALDIPTGLGKTSVIVIWLLALTRQVHRQDMLQRPKGSISFEKQRSRDGCGLLPAPPEQTQSDEAGGEEWERSR